MDAGTSAHCKQDRRSLLDQGLGQSIGKKKMTRVFILYSSQAVVCSCMRLEYVNLLKCTLVKSFMFVF